MTQPKRLTFRFKEIVGWILAIIGIIAIIGGAIWFATSGGWEQSRIHVLEWLLLDLGGVFLIIIGYRLAEGVWPWGKTKTITTSTAG